jgi:hypothetical protein
MTKLRITRLSLGLRQTDIQSITKGVIQQHRLSEIERGLPAKLEEAEALSEVFGLPVAELGLNLSEEAAAR